MAILLLISGSIGLIIGLTLALKTIKPMYFNVLAGVIILIGSFFGLFGKQLQDKNSSEKSDKILETGQNTDKKVSYLQIQNDKLTRKADELTNKTEQQGLLIDKLRTENTELYSKLAEANKEIQNNLTGGDSYCRMEIYAE